ncbi:hypothetical protein [Ruegeria sp. Alg231-54]|uniref:hypothetical protein n=1 Tax=Ruegeria sp. Alg231-54 TaxID=1922221 RepID=UPI00131F07C9|nr:hypothetical protein [Ruegeria sp. Alg231-54]
MSETRERLWGGVSTQPPDKVVRCKCGIGYRKSLTKISNAENAPPRCSVKSQEQAFKIVSVAHKKATLSQMSASQHILTKCNSICFASANLRQPPTTFLHPRLVFAKKCNVRPPVPNMTLLILNHAFCPIGVRHVADQQEQATSASDPQISPDFPKRKSGSMKSVGVLDKRSEAMLFDNSSAARRRSRGSVPTSWHLRTES